MVIPKDDLKVIEILVVGIKNRGDIGTENFRRIESGIKIIWTRTNTNWQDVGSIGSDIEKG